MLIAVSVVSAFMQETQKRWKLEAHEHPDPKQAMEWRGPANLENPELPPELAWPKEGFRIVHDPGDLGPAFCDAGRFGGFMFILDLDREQPVWRSNWGNYLATPSGFCFDGTCLFVADLEGSNLFAVDMEIEPGRLVRRLSHPALNDAHSVVRTRRGLLASSSGTDMVVELDLRGNCLFEWWAGDYGFTETPNGMIRLPERDREHRGQYYHTRYHTTHLNAACYRDREETRLLVLLWRQGQLIEIDTSQPPGKQAPCVVLDGLYHPHSIRRLADGGWMIANTQGKELIELDENLAVRRHIPSVHGWIQDALPLGDERWVVADVNRFCLTVHDASGRILQEVPYDQNWRVYGLEVVPEVVGKRLKEAARREAVL